MPAVPVQSAGAIKRCKSGKYARPHNRAAFRQPSWDTQQGASGSCRIPKACHATREGEPAIRTLAAPKGFELEVPPALTTALSRVERCQEPLFQRPTEPEFAQLLAALNQTRGTALHPDRVGRLLAKFMAQLGGNDRDGNSTSRGIPQISTTLVTSAVPVSRLQTFYGRFVRAYTSGRLYPAATATAPTSAPEYEKHTLARYTYNAGERTGFTVPPSLNAVAKLASEAGEICRKAQRIYGLRRVFPVLATTGLRGVSSPLPAHFDIDRATASAS